MWSAMVRKWFAGLKAVGITRGYGAGGRGTREKHYDAYKTLADRGELNARVFWTTIRQPATPAEVGKVLAEIQQHTPFQGSDTFDNIASGEPVYQPPPTNLLRHAFLPIPNPIREL